MLNYNRCRECVACSPLLFFFGFVTVPVLIILVICHEFSWPHPCGGLRNKFSWVRVLLCVKPVPFLIELPCVKPRRKHFGLINSFKGNKLTSDSKGMEGDKDTEMIVEKVYEESTIKEINLKNAIEFNASQTINALSFNSKFHFYHVHLQSLCFHFFFHKTCLLSPTFISFYFCIFRTE